MYIIKNKLTIVLITIFFALIAINIDYSINNRKYLNDFNQKNKFSIELIKKEKEFSYFKLTDSCILLPQDDRIPKLQGSIAGFNNFADINDDFLKVSYPSIKRDDIGVLVRELKIKNNQEVVIKLNCNSMLFPMTNTVYVLRNSTITK